MERPIDRVTDQLSGGTRPKGSTQVKTSISLENIQNRTPAGLEPLVAWCGVDRGDWVCRVAFEAEAPPLEAQKGNVLTHGAFEAEAPPHLRLTNAIF